MDLTKGDSNPMDNVSFFDYPQSTEKRRVPQHQISTMFPICNRVRLTVLIPCCAVDILWHLVSNSCLMYIVALIILALCLSVTYATDRASQEVFCRERGGIQALWIPIY